VAEIPQPVLDEIKHRIDIQALVSEHLSLKRSGRGFVGLCPFHEEKTPSFYVNPERGSFHCFGCNAGGNAFTFVMRMTGQTFPEVVRSLAERAGVAVPESRVSQGQDRLVEVNRLAAELFEVVLHESRRGERAREYLAQRGIGPETIRRFGLGFAPGDGWVEKLRGRGVSMADLKKLGLVSEGRSGPYPLFRDRLIFPIYDLSGRVIAFGGRSIGESRGPKYLNSPESPLYRKGYHLYGMPLAREEARRRDQVVLVEGYMDAIALAQAGLDHTVAVLGTALTTDQLKLARRFAADIVVCFDGDEAGRRAALRAFPLCVDEVDLWPRAVFLPAGEDPDSLVQAGGLAAMEERIDQGRSLADFFLDDLVGPDAGLGETARAASTMAGVLARVRDPIVRDKLVRGAAGRLGVSGDALLAAARKAHADKKRPVGAATTSPERGRRVAGRVRFSSDAEMVELIVCDRDVAERFRREDAARRIEDPVLRALADRVLERRESEEYFEPMEILGELPSAMAERVRRRLDEGAIGEVASRAASEWFARHEQRAERGDRQALIHRLRAAESRGDDAEVSRLLRALKDGGRAAPSAGPDSAVAGVAAPVEHRPGDVASFAPEETGVGAPDAWEDGEEWPSEGAASADWSEDAPVDHAGDSPGAFDDGEPDSPRWAGDAEEEDLPPGLVELEPEDDLDEEGDWMPERS
jgi:DNA primase